MTLRIGSLSLVAGDAASTIHVVWAGVEEGGELVQGALRYRPLDGARVPERVVLDVKNND